MKQLLSARQRLAALFFLNAGVLRLISAVATTFGREGAFDAQVPDSTPIPPEQPSPAQQSTPVRAVPSEGQLGARPHTTARPTGEARPGMYQLGLSSPRDGLLYIPIGYRDDQPAPLVLLLHGAGGAAQGGISLLRSQADAANLILLAPSSRRQTWDVIASDYGPDVSYIDEALSQAFSRYSVDPAHVGIGGFSDGASYALSLGLINGDLFTHILSYSPGFMAPTRQEGRPRIFNSHGTRNSVLPIDRCSRRIVPQLKRAGYDVTYKEFDGPHTVPPEIAGESVAWFTGA